MTNLQKSPDFDAIRAFLQVIGKPAGTARLRGFFPAGHPLKANDSGRKAPPSRRTVEGWQSEGRGVYVVINDGGDTDADITACRAFFCEWDDRPKDWQLTAWRDLGLPEPTIQVDTGGKSIHNYWVLADPISPQHWRIIQKRLLDHADADRTLKNPSRVMRLPGTFHVCADGTLGQQAAIVHTAENLYSVEQIEACLPDDDTCDHIDRAQRFTEYGTRSLQEITEALDCIPSAVPKQKQYAFYRNLLWSLIKACEEAGGTSDDALRLIQAHSPQFAEAQQVARSGGDQISAGTFWYWARHHGWKPPAPSRQLTTRSTPSKPQTVDPEALQLFIPTKNGDWLPLVDAGVFQRISARWICSDDLLHFWNGTHYEPIQDAQLSPLLAGFLQQLHTKESKQGEDIHPWARPRYVAEALAWMRAKLGATEVNPPNAINCQNGVISWTWQDDAFQQHFTAHNPDLAFTYVTDYAYDPEADPSHMLRLLDAVEPSDRDTLQRILGSSLDLAKYRATRGRPRAMLMIGSGSNGKDTIRTALRDTLGSRNFSSCTLADFRQYDQGRKFPIAPLRGAAINWSSENSQFVHIDSLQALKGAISGEELAWEVKGVQECNFVPNCLFVFNLNKEPSLTGEQAAIETRFHVFQFRKTYMASPTRPEHLKADPRLKDDPAFIQRYICPAFLNWLLEGLKLSIEHGIDYETGREAMRQVRRKGSHLWDFCDEVGLEWHEDAKTPLISVWARLCEWYGDEGFKDANGRWVIDPPHDPPVKASRLLVQRLCTVFPELKVEKDTKARSTTLVGVRLPPTMG
jgi:putative DNA primase/helicase